MHVCAPQDGTRHPPQPPRQQKKKKTKRESYNVGSGRHTHPTSTPLGSLLVLWYCCFFSF
jgi:aspartate carbamoyltransferase catalytic subunit